VKPITNFLLTKSWKQKTEILKIFYLYLKFSVIVEFMPLKYYYKKHLETVDYKYTCTLQLYKKELSLIKKLGRILPWKCKCIVESLVIKTYMNKFNIDLPISLGVSIDGGFSAHAWCVPECRTGFIEIRHKNEK